MESQKPAQILTEFKVLCVNRPVPDDLGETLKLLPGTIVAAAFWLPDINVVEVNGYLSSGKGYTHRTADRSAWLTYVQSDPMLCQMPLGSPHEEPAAYLVIDCHSRRAWVVDREYAELSEEPLPLLVARWVSILPS